MRKWIINLLGGWTQEQVEHYVMMVKLAILEKPDAENDPKVVVTYKASK